MPDKVDACKTCLGKGHLALYPLGDALHGPGYKDCPTCHGTGTNPSEPGLGSLPESPHTEAVTEAVATGTDKSRPVTNELKATEENFGNPADSLEQEIHSIVCGCDERGGCEDYGYWMDVKPGLLALIRHRESEAVEAFAERLKTYNGSFIEGALRHDHYVHHSVIDAELAKLKEGEK